MEADRGIVSWRSAIRVGYLGQEPDLDDTLSIRQQIRSSNTEVSQAIQQYEMALSLQSDHTKGDGFNDLNKATNRMDELNAWDYERRLTELLSRFRIVDLDRNIGLLSGGEKKRLALAITLLEDPEFLLLDEPTNHLDVDMIEWLEEYLDKSGKTILMVTHDRYFLDEVCNGILELYEGKFYKHPGDYGRFLQNKAERLENLNIEYQKDVKHLRSELEWVKRSPKARTGKRKSRINAYNELSDKLQGHKRAIDFDFKVKGDRVGGKVLEIKRLYKGFGENELIRDFTYTFKRGDRIGIAGPNGTGKSTLLKLIMGELVPDSGKLVRGETIKFGFYRQETGHMDPGKRVIDLVREVADVIELANGSSLSASLFLQKFDFDPQKQFTLVGNLSGGERRRLHLIMVLIQNPNFLILDEPTNDLDLLTLNKLESFLLSYPGCLLLVSHDRYFMDRVVDHLFIFDGEGTIRDYNGSYTEFRLEMLPKTKEEPSESELTTNTRVVLRERKLSFKEKMELETLDKEIPALENEIKQLENAINAGNSDFKLLQEQSELLLVRMRELDEKEMRWLELSEIDGGNS